MLADDATNYDFIVIGTGSAGCAVAAGLAERQAGSVLVAEAGPSDRSPLVRMPFGLVRLIGSRKRDWRYVSAPQRGLAGRRIDIPRGRMIGGSGSINSMVWFRGCRADFDGWAVPGWAWSDVEPAFEEVEARLRPVRLEGAHPLTESLHRVFGGSATEPPCPEFESGGVFRFNLHGGRRWSAADAFLRPALGKGVTVRRMSEVVRLGAKGDRVRQVHFADGSLVSVRKGVILSAGSIGTPEILLRSGIGPADDLKSAGIDTIADMPGVGDNLHDHPACGIHYAGDGSGYGLTLSQAATWARAPFEWFAAGRGVFASPTVEGGLFFNAAGDGGAPNIQSHFIPFMLGWGGQTVVTGSGYFADVTLCRPKSRGALRINKQGLSIDLGIFNDPDDLERLISGYARLRRILDDADFRSHKASEVYPGEAIRSEDEIRAHIVSRAATAYHPVGTMRMGAEEGPVTPRLKLKGVEGVWIADASVMPTVTSANTNAPSMMIGHRAGQFISEDAA